MLFSFFFAKRSTFPRRYVALLAVNAVVVALDAFAYWNFFHASLDYDLLKVLKDAAPVFVATLIWIPYMLVSDRVKATFVRPSKSDSPT